LLGKVKRQVESAVQLLPQLLAIKNSTHDKPQTTYYEGVEGIKAIYEDTLLCKEKVIYDILDPKKYLNLLGEDFQGSYVKRRVRRNIRIMALGPDDPENEKYINAEELREVRFFDRQAFNVPNEIMIYDNKVCLISFSSSMGVIVENSDIAQSMKAIWQMVWGNAKKSL
jgi:hypothetical protein